MAQVRQRVGEDLSLVPIGQDLESQDQNRIDQTYNETYQFLKSKGLAVWVIDGDIPDAVVPYLCLLMEEKLLNAYGVSETRYQRIKTDAGPNGATALADLAHAIVSSYASDNQAVDF